LIDWLVDWLVDVDVVASGAVDKRQRFCLIKLVYTRPRCTAESCHGKAGKWSLSTDVPRLIDWSIYWLVGLLVGWLVADWLA
jgi:hypothetical protein